jgi:molybdopterin molybdotransferase
MISLEVAEMIIGENASPVAETDLVELNSSAGRVLAEDVFSDLDMPPFNKSAMDGYACRREDLQYPLEVIETIAAGTFPLKTIKEKECAKIMTGARIPEGANCVIKIEDTSGITDNKIIFTAKESSDNFCYQGEDLKKGELVVSKGTIINSRITGLLASAGITRLQVTGRIRVGFFCTGSELIEPEEMPVGGQIRNSNASQLIAQISATCAIPSYHGIIADNKQLITDKLYQLIESYHIIIITGGASVGDFDFIPEIIKKSGFNVHFQKVSIQPGKPVIYASRDNKHIFGLSGNPVSSFLQFELLVKPLILKLSAANYQARMIQLITDDPITRENTERRYFVPVFINHLGHIGITPFHGSAHLNALKDIFGFAIVNEGIGQIKKGELVYVRPV